MFRAPSLRTAGLTATVVALASLTACGGQGDGAAPPSTTTAPTGSPAAVPSTTPTATPTAALTYTAATLGANGGAVTPIPGTGNLGSGFVTPSAPPPPGGTMTPSPGSWSQAHPPAGYRVALVSTDDSAQVKKLRRIVEQWAAKAGVAVTEVPAHDPANYLAPIQHAIDLHADLVIGVGPALADPLALVTASWIDQKFLVLGAELAEPTYNVTAAIWQNTSYRGGNGDDITEYDPAAFTTSRITKALEAGVAAVVRGYAGYVVKID